MPRGGTKGKFMSDGFLSAAFHGIGAYRGQRNPIALKKALDAALGGVELCGSDKAIGAFGAVFHGNCRAVFDCDVWSEVMPDGSRSCGAWQSVIRDVDQEKFEEFAKASEFKYCEAWVCPTGLRALWVKSWAPAATVKAARIMAKSRNVPLLILKGDQRIWEVYSELPTKMRIGK